MAAATALSRALGKTAVEAADYPGFIANRILMPMINEAVFALMEGVGTAEAIDAVMKLGMNHPMGPLTLADFIGLDVCLAILDVLHDGLAIRSTAPVRCCAGSWRPATSAASRAAVFTSMVAAVPQERRGPPIERAACYSRRWARRGVRTRAALPVWRARTHMAIAASGISTSISQPIARRFAVQKPGSQ